MALVVFVDSLYHFQFLLKLKKKCIWVWISVCELSGMKNTCIYFEQNDFISDAKPLMFQTGEKKILILMGVSLPHPLGHIQRCVYTVLVCGFGGTCLTCKAQTARSFPCFGLSTDHHSLQLSSVYKHPWERAGGAWHFKPVSSEVPSSPHPRWVLMWSPLSSTLCFPGGAAQTQLLLNWHRTLFSTSVTLPLFCKEVLLYPFLDCTCKRYHTIVAFFCLSVQIF